MTQMFPYDILNAPDLAREVVSIYDLLLNRNPDADEFHEGLRVLLAGVTRDELFRRIAGSDEVLARFMNNPNFELLINRLMDPTGQRTIVQKQEHVAWKAGDRPLRSDDPLSIMQIELTNECPFRCVMCPRTGNMTRPLGQMDFQLFCKIIDELAALHPNYASTQPPIWLHHFGESLTHPRFGDCIRYAKSRGIPTAMSINPLMLNERISAELLDAEPHALYLSLDGHDDESYERIRGVPRAYEKSRQRLLRFLERKVELGVKTHMTLSVIDFVLNGKQGDRQRIELESYWRAVPGIDEFLWKPYGTFSGEFTRLNELACPSEAEKVTRHYKDAFRVTCDFPWRRMVVTWTGAVVPCCHDYNVKMPLGDVRTQSLAEIWNGEKMLALRQEMISGTITNPVCRDCEHRYKNLPRDE